MGNSVLVTGPESLDSCLNTLLLERFWQFYWSLSVHCIPKSRHCSRKKVAKRFVVRQNSQSRHTFHRTPKVLFEEFSSFFQYNRSGIGNLHLWRLSIQIRDSIQCLATNSRIAHLTRAGSFTMKGWKRMQMQRRLVDTFGSQEQSGVARRQSGCWINGGSPWIVTDFLRSQSTQLHELVTIEIFINTIHEDMIHDRTSDTTRTTEQTN